MKALAAALGVTGTCVFAGLVVAWIARGPGTVPHASHVIEIRAMAFHPDTMESRVGDTLVWVNRDIVPHTVTAADSAWTSPPLAPGATWRRLATDAGPITYGCSFHPTMRGRINVRRRP